MKNNLLFKARTRRMPFSLLQLVLLLCVTISSAQSVPISGTVFDAQGSLPGVNVILKNKTIGTTTDANGTFKITVSPEDTLVFSSVGYLTVETVVGTQTTLKIILQTDENVLQEVLVNAGYYKVKDKERTGSIAKITAKDIDNQPVSNFLATMQGRMAGVDITQTTGMPGGGFELRIRGINSLRSAGNAPLYIIDGVPFGSDAVGYAQTSTNTPTPTSPLNKINPNDIESIEVLKDADATAIYGSRGSNGVVLITTKKGKMGKTKFSVSTRTGIGSITKTLDLLETPAYVAMRKKAFANDGIAVYPDIAYDINGTWDESRNTNWQKKLTGGTAEITTVQGTVSGGSSQTSFLMSGNSFSQTSVFPGEFVYRRKGIHGNLNHASEDKRFTIAFSGNYNNQSNDQPARDLTRISRNLAPNAPALYDNEGNLNWENSTWENPLAALNASAISNTNSLVANSTAAYTFPHGFILKASAGFTNLVHKETRTDPSTIYDPVYEAGAEYSSIFLTTSKRQSWILEPQLNWKQNIKEGKLEVLLGGTFQNQVGNRLVQYGSGFTSNNLIYNLASASTNRTYFDDETIYRYAALFGRINFSWKDKYFLNFTGRRDGSSRFGPGKQFANFGAIGAAWIFSEESSITEKMPFLSFGKLRSSFGITGNDQIGDYQYLDTYQSSTNIYDGTVGLMPTRLFNPNFSWETNEKMEAALELGFFKDKVFTTISYYRNRSSNQLIGMPLPGTTGFTSLQTNLDATVQNTGLELTLRTINVKSKDFEWSTDFNFSLPKNKLLAFPGLAESTYRNQYVIGQSINIQKLYHFTGVNSETGIYEFEDVNGDGILTFADDAQTTKDFSPKFYGGLQNQISYKRFRLDFLFQFVKQLNWNAASQFPVPGGFSNQPSAVAGAWATAGDVASTQIYTTGLNSPALNAYAKYNSSDGAVSDASYIRLKNIAIGYDVPLTLKTLTCRLTAEAQNLVTITPYKDGDPEFRSFNYLPPLKIISFGVEVNF